MKQLELHIIVKGKMKQLEKLDSFIRWILSLYVDAHHAELELGGGITEVKGHVQKEP